MVETLNREGGDDRDPAIAFQRTLEQIRSLPEYPGGYISEGSDDGIGAGDIVPTSADTRGYPTVLGRFSLHRSSIVLDRPLGDPPENHIG